MPNKEKENKENKENEKEETKKNADSCEFSKSLIDEKNKPKTNKKRKRSHSSSGKSVNSIFSKSKSKEKPYKKPHSNLNANTNSTSTTFMNKDPIYVKDLPYLLLNDFCIAGPLREEEFYLCACSNNELFISVWAMNRFNFSFQCSLYGHTKKPFKLIYNDNRKLLISAGMEWVLTFFFFIFPFYTEIFLLFAFCKNSPTFYDEILIYYTFINFTCFLYFLTLSFQEFSFKDLLFVLYVSFKHL